MDTIDVRPVDAERNDNLEKAKLEHGFYNIIDGEKVAASKRLSVINPATGKQLAAVPDVDRALLNKASVMRYTRFQDGVLFRSDAGKQYWLARSTK
jgi:hypothetical protein